MKLVSNLATGLAISTVLVMSSAVTGPASAGDTHFTFNSVEFMPRDQRVPAAEAFVASNIAPGMPMAQAIRVITQAEAACGPPAAPDGVVSCTLTREVNHSDDKTDTDVTWVVKLTPNGSDGVARATVKRVVVGM